MHTCYALLTCVRDMHHRMYTYLCVYVFTCSPFARQLVTLNTLYRPKRTAMQHRLCRAMQHREHQDVRTQSHVRTAPGRDVATRTGYAAPVRMVPSAHMSIKSGLARHATLRIGQDCCIRSFAWLRSDVPRGFVCSIQRLHHTVESESA